MGMNEGLLSEGRVIGCRVVGSGKGLVRGEKLGRVFMDEGGEGLEGGWWIGVGKGEGVILGGEDCELGGRVKNGEGLGGGVGDRLMEGMVKKKGEVVWLVKVEYGMKDEIMGLWWEWFYGGMLE